MTDQTLNTNNKPASTDWQQLEAQLQEKAPIQSRVIPPLERWQPANCGHMDLLVKANGEWWHEGRLITRQAMIDLFSKVLWAEVDDNQQVEYFLKTPVEKLQIDVEDAPLLITQVEQIHKNGQSHLQFTTSQGDVVIADKAHPIQFGLPFKNDAERLASQAERPYILVRKNGDSALYGLIHRNVFYHLIELGTLAEREGATILTLTSGEQIFELSMPNETQQYQ